MISLLLFIKSFVNIIEIKNKMIRKSYLSDKNLPQKLKKSITNVLENKIYACKANLKWKILPFLRISFI